MKIISTLLPPEDGVAVPVVDARLGSKNLVLTLVEADYETGAMGPVGRECIKRLGAHHHANYPEGVIHKVEMGTLETVPGRFAMVLASAADGDAVIFMCATPKIYDAVYSLLGLQHPRSGFASH